MRLESLENIFLQIGHDTDFLKFEGGAIIVNGVACVTYHFFC